MDVLQAQVVAAPACPDTSTWLVQGSSSYSNGRHQHTLQAGQPVHIEVDLRDAYGNLAGECDQPVLVMVAIGSKSVLLAVSCEAACACGCQC